MTGQPEQSSYQEAGAAIEQEAAARKERNRSLWRGAGAFVLINAVFVGAYFAFHESLVVSLLAAIVNLATFIYFAFRGKGEAMGMVVALAILLAFVFFVVPMFLLVLCFAGGSGL